MNTKYSAFQWIVILSLVIAGCTATTPTPVPPAPTQAPTTAPTEAPTITPTNTANPTLAPTVTPTITPTVIPSPTPTIALLPGSSGFIYFASDREGSFDIYKLDLADGSELRVTSDENTNEFFPHLSADGQWLSYWSVDPNDRADSALHLWKLSESEPKPIIKPALGWSSFSPDSQQIAIVIPGLDMDIFIVPLNTEFSMETLVFNLGAEYYPAWSPDGETIAYVKMEGDQPKIFLIDPDGKNRRGLFQDDTVGYSPAWSPDSKMIAFINGDESESQVYIINIDGSGLRQITSGPGIKDDPTWSPDGNWIAFWSNQDGDSEIFAISVDGNDLVQLTDNEFSDENPSWGYE